MRLAAKLAGIALSAHLMTSAAPAALAANRGFVVGIDQYEHLDNGTLHRAVADAKAVAAKLREIGFEIPAQFEITDRKAAWKSSLMDRFDLFAKSIKEGDTVVVFFSGHGMQLDAVNYLLPADAAGTDKSLLLAKEMAIQFETFLKGLDGKRPARVIFIVDACRNNPYKQGAANPAIRDGLAIVGGKDKLVLYSADSDETALDRLSRSDTDANSPFVRILLRHLTTPNLYIHEMGRVVREQVAQLTDRVSHKQRPTIREDIANYCLVAELHKCGSARPEPAQSAMDRIETATMAPSPSQQPAVPAVVRPAPTPEPPAGPTPANPAVAPSTSTGTALSQPSSAGQRSVHECDTLATWHNEPIKLAPPVVFTKLEHGRAIAACSRAVGEHPGEARYQRMLARAYQASKTSENLDKAIGILTPMAQKGDGTSIARLATLYWDISNDVQMIKWARAGADAGDPLSITYLGSAYRTGRGVAKDLPRRPNSIAGLPRPAMPTA